jgi:colanic acid/amylovoran biosynthesis glycosyltransferase
MKIAYIINHFPVLTETFILNQITGLIDQGHQVNIFCKGPYTDPIHHPDVDKYNLLNHTFDYMNTPNRLPENKLLRVIKAIGISLVHLNKKPLSLLKALNVFKFGRHASSLGIFYLALPFIENNLHEYDIAHCHYVQNGDLAAILKYLGVFKGKIVTTFHGEAGYTGEKRYKKGFERLFRVGDLFLPMSNKERENLINLGCDPKKIVIHRMGVDIKRFVFSPSGQGHNKKIRLLTVARLLEKKGVEYGIKAVAKVAKKYQDIEYRIVGDGPLTTHLQDLINWLNINEKVKILGFQTQQKLMELFNDSDIFLAPSVTSKDGDIEGIPVVIMEAMERGLPVLSTHHAGIPELVKDGISGFLVPERDPDALADKMEYLIEHQSLRARMGRAGRVFIEHHHDIKKLNDQLVFMFQKLWEPNEKQEATKVCIFEDANTGLRLYRNHYQLKL